VASTAVATALTERHRRRQLALRAATLKDMLTIWRAFQVDDIAGTWPTVETALVALIQARWAVSAGLAAAYYGEFRTAEGVTGPLTPTVVPPPLPAEVVRSLRIVGPAAAGRLVALARPDAAAVTLTNVAGDVSRQVLNGGRETLLGSVDRDPVALGYARVTDGKPCAFCAMLASRGPVYRSNARATVARDGAKYHRACGCTSEPVFSREQPWPGKGREFADLWKQAKRTARGEDGLTPAVAFRRAIEGR